MDPEAFAANSEATSERGGAFEASRFLRCVRVEVDKRSGRGLGEARVVTGREDVHRVSVAEVEVEKAGETRAQLAARRLSERRVSAAQPARAKQQQR